MVIKSTQRANFTWAGESDIGDVDVVKQDKNVLLFCKSNLVWIVPHKYLFLHAWLSIFVSIVLSKTEGQF